MCHNMLLKKLQAYLLLGAQRVHVARKGAGMGMHTIRSIYDSNL